MSYWNWIGNWMRQNWYSTWDLTLYTTYLIESKFIGSESEAVFCGTYFKWNHFSGIHLNGTKD